ncbi:DNA cross-link repair protein pso2/snm1 [Golovinomyces cichoracearum]|uniref:DNA cross-link repair protein pso2/snm1 n=1 Tax=Golovinomyces cichoracearum TaxID=62708 RepID=A0A420IKN4_9PEZI|nr:DNA cross-link repair protein pso2/snm1 [Golovinomyces cichoracearum]
MFRNPRENHEQAGKIYIKPSTGRPPTPPHTSQATQNNPFPPISASKSQTNKKTLFSSKEKLTKIKKISSIKTTVKPNTSILSFFKKVDTPAKEESIFLKNGNKPLFKNPSHNLTYAEIDIDEDFDFSEGTRLIKRQKLSPNYTNEDEVITSQDLLHQAQGDGQNNYSKQTKSASNTESHAKSKPHKIGPFLEDSDTDDESSLAISKSSVLNYENSKVASQVVEKSSNRTTEKSITGSAVESEHTKKKSTFMISNEHLNNYSAEPIEIQETLPKKDITTDTSKGNCARLAFDDAEPTESVHKETRRPSDIWADFEDPEFSGDEIVGEEFVGRKWIEEQAELEVENCDINKKNEPGEDIKQVENKFSSTKCPVCDADIRGINAELASRHVNMCLDGDSIPLSTSIHTEAVDVKLISANNENKFSHKAVIPNPCQTGSIEIKVTGSRSTSAFSQLMSGKAEDSAWKNAAESEKSSKGKPVHKRTCPFYKIIPGFSICVDAFRYGAVQGCNAYFLSHFHSDHYIGLSSSWCHGPIYCSKVTANLVKQQLRVDHKFVIPLDFDKKYEVPGTPNVSVSMIHANHCPGSSLFLFEKISGKETQRVLHCGDFRACPAHISHPLLMPDIVDSITGKANQQIIHVCYLDTTYLNPRYAFPPQDQVIQACADKCLALRNEYTEKDYHRRILKREHGNSDMSKYLESTMTKSEKEVTSISPSKEINQGRLLIVCGTYSIGKERIFLGIARSLDCKIFAPTRKMRIYSALEDEELMSRLTDDPREAQIHVQMLMEIRVETLQDYLKSYTPYFSRIVGFRPSGWTYKPPSSRGTQTATIPQILTSGSWRSSFSLSDLIPQRGSTPEVSCFGVPYSEHSSFRELTMFVCALRIEKVIPTVNIGSASGRAKMKGWINRWLAERRKNGPIKIGGGKDEVCWD